MVVSFGSAAYSVIEGSTVKVEVEVALDVDPERTVTVPLTVTVQDGASPADYSGVPASVTFNSGEVLKTFTFSATQDDVDDDGESVKLAFGTPLPPSVGAGTVNESTVNIQSKTPLTASVESAPPSHNGSNKLHLSGAALQRGAENGLQLQDDARPCVHGDGGLANRRAPPEPAAEQRLTGRSSSNRTPTATSPS